MEPKSAQGRAKVGPRSGKSRLKVGPSWSGPNSARPGRPKSAIPADRFSGGSGYCLRRTASYLSRARCRAEVMAVTTDCAISEKRFDRVYSGARKPSPSGLPGNGPLPKSRTRSGTGARSPRGCKTAAASSSPAAARATTTRTLRFTRPRWCRWISCRETSGSCTSSSRATSSPSAPR